jgi:hypothetical protein
VRLADAQKIVAIVMAFLFLLAVGAIWIKLANFLIQWYRLDREATELITRNLTRLSDQELLEIRFTPYGTNGCVPLGQGKVKSLKRKGTLRKIVFSSVPNNGFKTVLYGAIVADRFGTEICRLPFPAGPEVMMFDDELEFKLDVHSPSECDR